MRGLLLKKKRRRRTEEEKEEKEKQIYPRSSEMRKGGLNKDGNLKRTTIR